MQLPFISVILPVRNEERYIAACVDSIFSQDYPAEKMEVIFVDGRSEDRTVEMLHAMQKNHPQIVVLDNPNRTVPYAMNIGIAHSSAPVIVRLDAHAEYPADYIRLSVETLLTQDCDNAGGVFETHGRGFMGEAIAEMLKTPLGVGNATYRLTTEDGYVDTVPFGCFKRELFERIGGFDERMTRNQDNELNFRIRKNGGKIYLNHNIRVQYYCRDTMRGIMKMGYMNGKWNVITMTLVPGSMGVRHFVPLAFVLSTILLVLLTAASILKGEENVHIFGRRIENDLLRRACSIVVVYFTMGMLATLAICAVQPEFTLQQVLIEVFSAIDTVGLTTGITRDLNTFSRIVIIMLMYAGRLGSMTFIILLTRRKPPAPVQYPTDKVIIG